MPFNVSMSMSMSEQSEQPCTIPSMAPLPASLAEMVSKHKQTLTLTLKALNLSYPL